MYTASAAVWLVRAYVVLQDTLARVGDQLLQQNSTRSSLQSSMLAQATRSLLRCGARPATAARALCSAPEFGVERLSGEHEGVAVFTMNRPASKNALGRLMMDQFRAALDDVRFDPTVRVVVVQSTVERVFCAGADLKERLTMEPPEVAAFVHGLRSAFTGLEQLPMPTIAAIEGAALGGGLELALACDFRVCGEAALIGLPETSLAIIPGAGGTQRVMRFLPFLKRGFSPLSSQSIACYPTFDSLTKASTNLGQSHF